MKKTVRGMIKEMFEANYEEVYTLSWYHYCKYNKGKINIEELEKYTLEKVPHCAYGPKVKEMYTKFQSLSK